MSMLTEASDVNLGGYQAPKFSRLERLDRVHFPLIEERVKPHLHS